MKKRILLFAALILCVSLLAGCQCSHEWTEADCTTAKTCTKCEETEGEPLGHTWEDASCAAPKTCSSCGATEGEALEHTWSGDMTYQTPEVCTVCGAEGSKLPAFFEENGLTVNVQAEETYDYITCTFGDPELESVGQFCISNYQIFESDESHKAKEGYEWRTVDITITYTDENSSLYGTNVTCSRGDYYTNPKLSIAGDKVETFSVNFNGQDYADCTSTFKDAHFDVEESSITFQAECAVQVPAGYDGVVLAFYHSNIEADGMYLNEIEDENMLIFRFA